MSFLIFLNQFDVRNVYLEPANTSPNACTRIMYSTPHISLNPVGCVMQLVATKITQHYNHKWTIHFDASHPVNAGIIDQFRKIETSIVNKFMHSGLVKKQHCVFANSLTEGVIKTENEADAPPRPLGENQFVLYILGLWETPTEFGISCKFAKW